MFSAFLLAIKDRRIPIIAVALLLLGFTYASAYPFQSLIGINQLKFSSWQFGLIIFGIGFANMAGTLVLGALSDYATNRKTFVLWCLGGGAIGFGLFAIFPSRLSFLICLFAAAPLASAAYAQLFGTVRRITEAYGSIEAASINSLVRTFYAISWLVVPGAVGYFIAYSNRASDAFAIASLAFVLCFIFYWRMGPDVAGGTAGSASPFTNLHVALRLIFTAGRLPRVLALSLIYAPQAIIGAIFPLILINQLGGTTAQLGYYAGLTALIEMPLMIIIGQVARLYPLWIVIAFGGAVHAGFMIFLGLSASIALLYIFSALNALGNAVLLTQHMSYCQNLVPDRPGLGSSLMSIEGVIARGLGAVVFGLTGWLFGYLGALIFGAVLCLSGCAMLMLLDRQKSR